MSNVDKIGELLDGTEHHDAIHIAIAPVVAGGTLHPASPITFKDGAADKIVVMCPAGVSIGIVDPFLKKPVRPGDRFYMFLNPNTITSLRHEWTHPAFKPEEDEIMASKKSRELSEAWLRNFCAENDCPGYDDLMAIVRGEKENDGYNSGGVSETSIWIGGQDASGEIPDEFWDHVEIVTGKKPPHRPSHFSCSC